MSGPSLAEVLPPVPEQFPDSSVIMPYDLRTEAFWPVCRQLLQGTVDVNDIGETPPEGWRSLRIRQTDLLHNVALLNAEHRISISTTVSESGARSGSKVVHGNIRVFGGESELEVSEHFGSECIEHRGMLKSGLTFRGVLGGTGNPYFTRPGVDCDPEIQDLTLWVQEHEGGEVDVAYDEGVRYEFPIPGIAHYAFFDKPPLGDESLIEIASHVADLLEDVAYQTVM